jgi:putative transposase
MVSPRQRRDAVAWAQTAYQLTVRRACLALGVHRSLIRYRSRKRPDTALRARLRELATTRLSFGARRLHLLLRREGVVVNHKRVHRLYVEEGLQLTPRRRPRRRAHTTRRPPIIVSRPGERWAMDFMHDTLADGRTIRVFTLVDVYSRECVALAAAARFTGTDVAELLRQAAARTGGLPAIVQCDNGTEFTSVALDHWAYWNQVQLDFSRPGKPVDNCVCEAFNGSLRRECLSQHWFTDLTEAQQVLDQWRDDYNNLRPHTSLGGQPPASHSRGGHYLPRAIAGRI